MLNVIVLHWEDPFALKQCLRHLSASDYPHLRVIVVENGSSAQERSVAAGVVAGCGGWFDHLEILQLDENRGYAGGNNAGLVHLNKTRLGGEVCILNPDVCVQEGTLSTMMRALSNNVGLVMCRAVSDTEKVLYDGIRVSGFRQSRFVSELETVETDYAQGACFLVRRELVSDGIFDERFFLYWEEVDLAFRVRSAGFRVVSVTTTSIIRHKNDVSRLPNALYYSARNGLLMLHKHRDRLSGPGYVLYWLSLLLIAMKLLNKPRLFATSLVGLFRAVGDGRAGKYGKRSSRLRQDPRIHTAQIAPLTFPLRRDNWNESES